MSNNFLSKNFAVVGIGLTGLSIIKYLHYQKAKIIRIFDTREQLSPPAEVGQIELHLGKLDYANFSDIDVIVISPGISIYEEALQMAMHFGKEVIGDIELFARAISNWDSKIVGITGSNGKTTVTSLTGKLLSDLGFSTLIAGNIGTPVLSSYLEIVSSGKIPQMIVLELSSFQLETTSSLKLSVATVLNISQDHLDRYRDLLEYAYIKGNIFNNCKVQVLNSDDSFVIAMSRSNITRLFFGESSSNLFTIKGKYLLINGQNYLMTSELNLVGRHNYFNVLASLALLHAIGINIEDDRIRKSLTIFSGLEHRMQKIATKDGIIYIEDSKATNVGSVVAGVSGLDGMVHLILGGDGKGQDFTPLRALVEEKCKSVAVIGQDKLAIMKVLHGLNVSIKTFDTLEDAVAFCCKNALNNEYVVLSPACASWDMFDDYKHRARVFIESVHENIR